MKPAWDRGKRVDQESVAEGQQAVRWLRERLRADGIDLMESGGMLVMEMPDRAVAFVAVKCKNNAGSLHRNTGIVEHGINVPLWDCFQKSEVKYLVVVEVVNGKWEDRWARIKDLQKVARMGRGAGEGVVYFPRKSFVKRQQIVMPLEGVTT